MKYLYAFLCCCSCLFVFSNHIDAQEAPKKVLVIYSSTTSELDEHQRALDMLLGHFTEDITFVHANDVDKSHLSEVSHLFYFGYKAEKLPDSFQKLFDDYQGKFVAIGYNSEQLGDKFSFLRVKDEISLNEFTLERTNTTMTFEPQIVIDISIDERSETLISGKMTGNEESRPVMVHADNNYYYALDSIWSHESTLFGEALHEVFDTPHEQSHPAYMRLEDIHPLSNADNLEEIGQILAEKNIPYMIAVIPVYTDPTTGRKHHFSDSPKLLKVLKKLQNNGASIVLHGYTHQYRLSETGEGFEFWDVDNNRPIYTDANNDLTLETKADFTSETDYEKYLDKLKAFERSYIEERLTLGIEELVNYGLYPLAFEAPHYTMSQQGYEVVSEYFSTYVGQIQLSDKDWEIMDSTLYITTPSFLHGMELIPETLGYVVPGEPASIDHIIARAKERQATNDGVLAAFYHPYLGVEQFKQLLAEFESIPHLSWIDLKERDNLVQTDLVQITTEAGEVSVQAKSAQVMIASMENFSYHSLQWLNMLAWILVILGTGAIIAFIAFTTKNIKYHKRNVGG